MSKSKIDNSIKKARKDGLIDDKAKSLFEGEEPKMSEAKVKITTMIDYDLKKLLKEEAKEKGLKYQSLLNSILKDHFSNKEASVEERLTQLEERLSKLTG